MGNGASDGDSWQLGSPTSGRLQSKNLNEFSKVENPEVALRWI